MSFFSLHGSHTFVSTRHFPVNIPVSFHSILSKALPEVESAMLMEALQTSPKTSVRLHPRKGLEANQEHIETVLPWETQMCVLKERPLFVADPAFHAGCYYVQESSSSFIGWLVEQLTPELGKEATLLDLCAAPGGKSTHIATKMPKDAILVANEIIHSRTPILHENLCKWGLANHIVTQSDASSIGNCDVLFQLILADMPCSGEGMFRKDPNAMEEWSEDAVVFCAERQKKIAADVWPSVAESGYFIYSTCTFNSVENEENVDWICENLGAEVVTFPIPKEWNIYQSRAGMYRFLPHKTPGEGLFCAVLRKTSHAKSKLKSKVAAKAFVYPFGDSLPCFYENNNLYTIRNCNEARYRLLCDALPSIYQPGTPVATLFEKKGGARLKPLAPLALCVDANLDAFETQRLEDAEALHFLHREVLKNIDKRQGFILLNWQNIPLGFANAVGNSMNNLWPMEWRIRMKTDAVSSPFWLKKN